MDMPTHLNQIVEECLDVPIRSSEPIRSPCPPRDSTYRHAVHFETVWLYCCTNTAAKLAKSSRRHRGPLAATKEALDSVMTDRHSDVNGLQGTAWSAELVVQAAGTEMVVRIGRQLPDLTEARNG